MSKLKNFPKSSGSKVWKPLPTQQFGVTLAYIKEHNGGDPIPPVLRQAITFLDHPDGRLIN